MSTNSHFPISTANSSLLGSMVTYTDAAGEVVHRRRGNSAGAPTTLPGSILNRRTAGRGRSIRSSSLASNESLGRLLVSVALREAIILADTHQLGHPEDEKEHTLVTN
jgi:hypothetical protein